MAIGSLSFRTHNNAPVHHRPRHQTRVNPQTESNKGVSVGRYVVLCDKLSSIGFRAAVTTTAGPIAAPILDGDQISRERP